MNGHQSGRPLQRIVTEALLGQGSHSDGIASPVDAVYLLYVVASVPAFFVKSWSAGRQFLSAEPATLSNSMTDFLLAGLAAILPLLVVALAVSLMWAMIFARVRGRPVDPAWAVTPWIYVLLLPADLSPVLVALGMSFAAVFGQHGFGGSGRYIVSPALLGALFVQYSYPNAAGLTVARSWQQSVEVISVDSGNIAAALAINGSAYDALPMLVACFVGVIPLVRAGIVSIQLLAGAALGAVIAATLVGFVSDGPVAALSWYWHLVLGSMPVCLAFVLTDPTAQALTRGGRWIHGFLFASLVVTIRLLDPAHPDGALFAALLATLAVPLVDYLVCRRNAARSAGRLVLRS